MLVLTRKANESILIGGNIRITVNQIDRAKVRIGIEAPPEIQILRSELVSQQLPRDPEPAKQQMIRILIVEDDEVDRAMIRRCLSASGNQRFSFLESSLGQDGLARCRQERPDCVVLDYGMPDLDGLEFLHQLRDEARGRQIPVLMVSGHLSEQVALEAIRQGAQGVLAKQDFSAEKLRTAVLRASQCFSAN